MKTLISILFILAAMTLISISMKNSGKEQYMPESEKVVNHLMGKAAKMLSQKYKVRLFATDRAMPGGCVKLLGFQFQITGPQTQDDLRKILIGSAQDFLSMINADGPIKRYLQCYPFTMDNIDIGLFLVDKDGRSLEHPHIGIASISNEKLEYQTLVEIYDEKIKMTIPRTKDEYQETYEEAKKLVEDSK